MKKVLPMAAFAAALTACGSFGLTPAVDVTPQVQGGEVVVDVKYDAATGNPTSIETTLTQPSLSFLVAPGSLGMTVEEYSVEVLDAAGVSFDSVNSLYKRAIALRVPGGFACDTNPNTDQCSPLERSTASRTVVANDAELLLNQLGDDIAEACAFERECPTLQMKLTFYGRDDNGREVTIPLQANASIQARIASAVTE